MYLVLGYQLVIHPRSQTGSFGDLLLFLRILLISNKLLGPFLGLGGPVGLGELVGSEQQPSCG